MAYILQTRKTDTLASDIAAGATSLTLTTGNFGTPSGQQIITVDYDVAAKAADFLCTIAGTAVTSMTLLNGPDVAHSATAKIAMNFVDEHYAALLDGTAGFNFDKARVTKSADQSISDNTETLVTWNQEDFDTNTLHDNSSNTSRFTVSKTGKYIVEATLNWAGHATDATQRSFVFLVNGTTVVGAASITQQTATSDMVLNGVSIVSLTAGDYIEVKAYQNSGGSVNIQSARSHYAITFIP